LNRDGTEVFVQMVTKDRGGRTVVLAVPNNQKSVDVGDRFIWSYEAPQARDGILAGSHAADPVNVRAVSLTVRAITTRDSETARVELLPHGHTAGLYLEGDGLEFVTNSSLLVTEA